MTRSWAIRVIVFLTFSVTIARVAATYPYVSATSDEPAHISCGMEWLQFGTYTYERQHPPLGRIAVALGPYLRGLRSKVKRSPEHDSPTFIFEEGYNILYSKGNYDWNLALARLGNVPFLLLLGITTYAWGCRYFSQAAGVLALVLTLSLPPILGQAGVATLDLGCAATVTFALYEFSRWLDDSSSWRGFVLGTAVAIAVLTKFSAIPFLLVSFVLALGFRFMRAGSLKIRANSVLVCAVAAFFVLWVGCRFTLLPIGPQYGPHPNLDRLVQSSPAASATFARILNIPLPLTELALGVRDLWRHNDLGQDSYLLGEYRRTGWWYFFPVAVAVKTPIGFLTLALAGMFVIFRRWRSATQPQIVTVLFFLGIFLFAMTSRIDAGIRHILAIYPPLALIGADFAVRVWRASRKGAILASTLVVLALAESAYAHPDYLAHFNVFAGAHPERILCESDLDLGQDLGRLSRRLHELGADHVTIAYAGSAPLDKAGLPRYLVFGRDLPEPGYIAVSMRYLYLDYARNGTLAWLHKYEPKERIGRSINLYYIDSIPQ